MLKRTAFAWLILSTIPARGQEKWPEPVTIQFFGDFYVAERQYHNLKADEDPDVFANLAPLMQQATYNVVNLEGVISSAPMPYVLKSHRLRMPFRVAPLMQKNRITIATLANNHSMDFGYSGLFDTLSSLQSVGIATTGAGRNAEAAAEPAVLYTQGMSLCILAFNRTYPQEFYAGAKRPGTNSPPLDTIVAQIRQCTARFDHTFVAFHWGWEQSPRIQAYQQNLAQAAIDAGASAVIGHHPHVLQTHTVYKGRPIFYSLGNFIFTTAPRYSTAQGLAVRLSLGPKGLIHSYELIPLNVDNHHVHFRPRRLNKGEKDPVRALLGAGTNCQRDEKESAWQCHGQAPISAGVKRIEELF